MVRLDWSCLKSVMSLWSISLPLSDGTGVEKPFKNDFGLCVPPLVRLLGPVGMGCRTVVEAFGVVFEDVELEDAALACASEVNNALGARGGALPDIVEDDDVGENKRDSASTATTTLDVVFHATPQRTISSRRNDGDTQPTGRKRDSCPVFLYPER